MPRSWFVQGVFWEKKCDSSEQNMFDYHGEIIEWVLTTLALKEEHERDRDVVPFC